MYDLQAMQMPQPTRDLLKRPFGLKTPVDIHPHLIPLRTLDNVSQRSRTKLQCDVKEIFVGLLVEVADDVRVVVGFLEDGDFALGQGDEVAEETFDGDGAALEGALEDDGAV